MTDLPNFAADDGARITPEAWARADQFIKDCRELCGPNSDVPTLRTLAAALLLDRFDDSPAPDARRLAGQLLIALLDTQIEHLIGAPFDANSQEAAMLEAMVNIWGVVEAAMGAYLRGGAHAEH